jgi:hypothetical protein
MGVREPAFGQPARQCVRHLRHVVRDQQCHEPSIECVECPTVQTRIADITARQRFEPAARADETRSTPARLRTTSPRRAGESTRP